MILMLFLFGGNKNACWIYKKKEKKMSFAAAWRMGWRNAKVEAKRPVKRSWLCPGEKGWWPRTVVAEKTV